MAWDWGTHGVAAGLCLYALGSFAFAAFVLRASRHRAAARAAAVLFGANGLAILATATGIVAPSWAATAGLATLMIDLATYPAIVLLALLVVRGRRPLSPVARALVASVTLAAAATGALFVIDPAGSALGTGGLVLLASMVLVSFFAAMGVLLAGYRDAPDARLAAERGLLFAGFAIVILANGIAEVPLSLAGVAHPVFAGLFGVTGWSIADAMFLLSLPMTAGLVLAFHRAARRRGDATTRRAIEFIAAYAAVSMGILTLGQPSLTEAPWTVLVGTSTFMVVRPVLLTYGMLKYNLLDVDLKVKWTISRGAVLAAFVAVFVVVAEVAQNWLSDSVGLLAGGVAAGLLVFALRPLERAADRLADRAMPHVRADGAYLAFRRVEIYRASLARAMEDGVVTEKERAILDGLRAELGLTDADHARIAADLGARAA